MRKVLFLTVVLAFAMVSAASAAGIAGSWAVKMKSPMGEDEAFTITITAAGENLTITSSDHPKLTNLEGTGTLKGDAIAMNLKATGQMAIEFALTGTVSDNKMTGTREIKMDESGRQGGAPGGEGGAPGGEGVAPGGEGGAPPEGGTPPEGGAPGEGASAASAASAESGGPGGAPGGAQGEVSNVFTAEKI